MPYVFQLLYGDYTNASYSPNYTFPSEQKNMLLHPAGTELYVANQVLDANPLSLKHTYEYGIPTLSADGSVVHYLSGNIIRSYNASTHEKLQEMPFRSNYIRKLQVSSGNSTFIILCLDYSIGDRIFFIGRNQ